MRSRGSGHHGGVTAILRRGRDTTTHALSPPHELRNDKGYFPHLPVLPTKTPPQGQTTIAGVCYMLMKRKGGLDIVARDKGVGREVRSQPHLGWELGHVQWGRGTAQ